MGNRGAKAKGTAAAPEEQKHGDEDAKESQQPQQHTTAAAASEGAVVSGLTLVEGVIATSGSPSQHDTLVAWVRSTLELGRAGKLAGNTYAPIPDKWKARNQSREMLQFGTYTHSNRVESHVPVAPLPEELTAVVGRRVQVANPV
jgi:hypothetical protein